MCTPYYCKKKKKNSRFDLCKLIFFYVMSFFSFISLFQNNLNFLLFLKRALFITFFTITYKKKSLITLAIDKLYPKVRYVEAQNFYVYYYFSCHFVSSH